MELIRDLMGIYTVAKFGTDWSIFADARVLTKSNMQGFPCKFLFLRQQIRQILKIGASSSQQREPVTVIVHMPLYAHSPTTFFKVLS